MGFDLALERDYLAHGNLKNDYKIKSALPLIYLEYLIYSIQLKLFWAEDKSIQNAICDLFSD